MKSKFGKNNFDRLEAAGLVEGNTPTDDQRQAKIEARVIKLQKLESNFGKINAAVVDLYLLDRKEQLQKLSSILAACKKLHARSLPVGTKKHVGHVINELTSLREGVFQGSASDKMSLSLMAGNKAKEALQLLIAEAQSKISKVKIAANDMDDFYKQAEDVINKSSKESHKVEFGSRPFVVARVPVVPAALTSHDGISNINKLNHSGFKAENLGGYAVIHNQLVIGINPAKLEGKVAELSNEKTKELVFKEAERLRKSLQKVMKVPLQYVSQNPFSYKGSGGKGSGGIYYWLMSDKELTLFARAFPGGNVKVPRWGFAFS